MNQKMLELLQGHTDQYPKYVEANYPHIFAKLIEYWGTNQMYSYLDELVFSKRSDRQGFPAEAAAEVWALSGLYRKMWPEAAASNATDVWREDSETVHTDWKDSVFKGGANNE